MGHTQGEIMRARLWPRTCPLTTFRLPSSRFENLATPYPET